MTDVPTIKYDPVTHMVATRTVYPEDGPAAWGVMTVDHGGHYYTSADVEGWPELDLPVDEAPTP